MSQCEKRNPELLLFAECGLGLLIESRSAYLSRCITL